MAEIIKLTCDKPYFRWKGFGFNNCEHLCNGKDNSYKALCKVPIEIAEIKDDNGNVINKPTETIVKKKSKKKK